MAPPGEPCRGSCRLVARIRNTVPLGLNSSALWRIDAPGTTPCRMRQDRDAARVRLFGPDQPNHWKHVVREPMMPSKRQKIENLFAKHEGPRTA